MESIQEADNISELMHEDLPERILKTLKNRLLPSKGELDEEAAWICRQLPAESRPSAESVKKYLETFRIKRFDAPYVYTYRPELYDAKAFSTNLIWEILRLDRGWAEFNERRNAVLGRVVKAVKSLGEDFDYVCECARKAEDIFEVEDVEHFVAFSEALASSANISQNNINMPIPGLSEGQQEVARLRALKFNDLVSRFALRPKELNENLKAKKKEKSPPEIATPLQILATTCLAPAAPNTEIFITSQAVAYIANEIAATQPLLRKNIRAFMLDNSLLSTLPTEKGEKELNAWHPHYRVKRILNRPLTTLQDDIWLAAKCGESEGLVTCGIRFEGVRRDELNKWAENLVVYDSSQANEVTEEYNDILKAAMKVAIDEHLIPNIEKQIRQHLENNAAQFVVRNVYSSFKEHLMVPPFFPTTSELGGCANKSAKTLSAVVGEEKQVQVVVLNDTGKLLEERKLMNLVDRSKNQDKKLDLDVVCSLLKNHQPSILIVGATCPEAEIIFKDLTSLLGKCYGEVKPQVKYAMHPFPDALALDSGVEEFPNPALRLAASLGRYTQSPLAEILYLLEKILKHSKDKLNDVMCVHPLQFMAGRRAVKAALRQAATECVNKVGVNINLVANHGHLKCLARYVSGLGKAKADSLLKAVRDEGDLKKRIDLLDRRILKEFVYKNCAGFITIVREMFDMDSNEILDTTRIHPDFYTKAREYALASLTKLQIEVPLAQNDNLTILQAVQRNDEKSPLEEFLNATRESFEVMLLSELNEPFKFPKEKHFEVSSMQLAYTLCGIESESLFEGQITSVSVLSVDEKTALCRLGNGLEGLLEYEGDMSQKRSVKARVMRVVESGYKLAVSLSAKAKDLSQHNKWINVPYKDRKWFVFNLRDVEVKEAIMQESQAPQSQEKSRYAARSIIHPRFRNVSITRAIEHLSTRETGEYIFRPSSISSDHLTLTLMFYKNVYVHIDVKEELKGPDGPIGERLLIGRSSFSTLDEIAEKYINPVITRVKEVASNRKFINNRSLKFLKDYASLKREENPELIAYYLGIVPDYPQYIVLVICPREGDVITEYAKVKPEGYYFHDRYFDNIEELIDYFKKHFASTEYRLFLRRRNRPPVLQDEPSKRVEKKIEVIDENAKTEYLPNTEYQYTMNSIRIENDDQPICYEKGQFSVYGGEVKSRADTSELHGKRQYPEERDDSGFKQPYAPGEAGWHARGQGRGGRRGGRYYDRFESDSGFRRFNTIEEGDRADSWGSDRGFRSQRRGTFGMFSRSSAGEGRRFRRGGSNCFNCGDEGHISRDCPKPSRRGPRQSRGNRGGRGCFNCKEESHISRDCPKRDSFGGSREGCFNCGRSGHMSRDCPDRRERGGRGDRRGAGRRGQSFGGRSFEQREVSWNLFDKSDTNNNEADEKKEEVREDTEEEKANKGDSWEGVEEDKLNAVDRQDNTKLKSADEWGPPQVIPKNGEKAEDSVVSPKEPLNNGADSAWD
eukprot:TRINITY_DN2781_c0_g4_i9.p1 TRINITY_DN2781_c0_g4~~TRINITY_DN2781_c0_g4_i9.p1  ORF type:complete len:1481 (+),score=370.11 TRINITY_DN2781_c0_g4_i9:244-4686(+)